LATAGIFGGDLDLIEARMTWPRWITINDAWAENPPTHMILAAVHLKRSSSEPKGDLGDLFDIFG
jgi:hypothetical protein